MRIRFLFAFLFTIAAVVGPRQAAATTHHEEADHETSAENDAAFRAMVGREASPDRVQDLTQLLRAASLPASSGGAAADLPLLSVLHQGGTSESPRYEVSGIAIEIAPLNHPRLRIEDASFAVMPAADGRSCRFELSGSPLTSTATLKVHGSIEWGAGPAGGDKVEAEYSFGGVPLTALREWMPERFDPSLTGLLRASGRADGVIGETSSEMAPATPLRGTFDAALDWQVLGRTAPLSLQGGFSIDDRMVRVVKTHAAWLGIGLDVNGWFHPEATRDFRLVGKFTDIDTAKVAADWNVPAAWTPQSLLSGAITLEGTPGSGRLRFEALAPSVVLPGLAGWDVRMESAKFVGSLLAINAEVSTSVMPKRVVVGGIDLGDLVSGIRWWRNHLTVSTANTTLWGGDNDTNLNYDPAEAPAFLVRGRIQRTRAQTVATALVPWLHLDVDGAAATAFELGQDAERHPKWGAHASLTSGRLGGADLFGQFFDALAAVDPALAPDAARELVPRPHKGAEGTRADQLFFELDRTEDGFEIGGLLLRAGEFQLDADGRFSREEGLGLQGRMGVPAAAVEKIVAAAPWAASLCAAGTRLFVPVAVSGPPSAPSLTLGAGYADLVASAKRGEKVTAPGAYEPRHSGVEGLAKIPGDPGSFHF